MRRYGMWMLGVCAVLMSAQDAQAGPWTKKQGEYYAKVSELWFGSDTFVAPSGARVKGEASFTSFTTALYTEVGLLDGLHFQAFVPYVWATNYFEKRQTTYGNLGLGDVTVALQWTPVELPIPWALRLDAKIPGYDVAGIQGAQATSFPVFGDGQVDVTAWLSVGKSFHPAPVYVLGEVGYRARTELFVGKGNGRTFLDSVPFSAQVGWEAIKGGFLVLNVGGVVPLGDDDVTQRFVTVGPGVAVNVWKGLSLEATVNTMFWSKNNSPGPGASFGVSYKGTVRGEK